MPPVAYHMKLGGQPASAAPDIGVEPLFKETGCRAMRLEIFHQMKKL